jgi:prepilin-type N-terminal cleavage/methylation domain-containing protein/prepilin-type processing-associated H-X9-DG protein
LLGHNLHTPNAKSVVKQSCFSTSFSLSLSDKRQYHPLLTPNIMAKSSPPRVQRAFTLIEVLVVIAIIIGLAAIVIPSLKSALEAAKATKDLSNLRQVGALMQSYLNDKDGILPVINAAPGIGTNGPPPMPVIYPKYVGIKKVFQSPFDKRTASETDSAPVSYGINVNMYAASPGIAGNTTRIVSPSSTILVAPNYNGNPGVGASWTGLAAAAPFVPNLAAGGGAGMTTGTQRNGQKINALFCDLHVETMTFGPAGTAGTFKDTTSDPLGLKHWDPTK